MTCLGGGAELGLRLCPGFPAPLGPPHRISVAFPNSGSHSDFSLHLEHCVLVVFKIRKRVFILKGEFY